MEQNIEMKKERNSAKIRKSKLKRKRKKEEKEEGRSSDRVVESERNKKDRKY